MTRISKISTRLATASDGARLSRVVSTFREEIHQVPQVSAPLPVSVDGPNFVLLAEIDERIVGILAVNRPHSIVRGTNFLLLTDIYVVPEERHKGVATVLLNEANALARRLGCNSVNLMIAESNTGVVATALRTGFVKCSDLLLTCNLK